MSSTTTFTIEENIRALFCAIWFIMALFLAMFIMVPVYVVSLGRLQSWLIHFCGNIIGRGCLFFLGVKIRMVYENGKKPSGPAVFVINHASTLDVPILLALQVPNIRFVAKYELQYNPFIFILGNLTGNIFIDRSNSNRAIKKLNRALGKIKQRKLSLLFAPEGSRSHQGVIGPFKTGAFHMAIDLDYPMELIYIENAKALCPGGALVSKKGEVVVTYKEQVSTEGWKKETIDEHIRLIRKKYLDWAGIVENDSTLVESPKNQTA